METITIEEVLQQVEEAILRIDEAAMNSGNPTVFHYSKNILKELNDIKKKLKKFSEQ